MPVEKIVYVLGAGFSRPLGLPVMADFIEKAKDMFAEEPGRYETFKTVFDDLRAFAPAMSYVDLNLLNIEEVLSMFEMRAHVNGHDTSSRFREFLGSVIERYTPSIGAHAVAGYFITQPSINDVLRRYLAFTGSLMSVCTTSGRGDNRPGRMRPIERPLASYAVVSLNYDRVVESAESALRAAHDCSEWPVLPLAISKLHGDAKLGNIVAPTWLKGRGDGIREAWAAAHARIMEANQIRFVGFSLPSTDTYIKYLIASALADAPNLRQIDVVCLDPSGDVERRYRSLVRFRNLRFANSKAEDYLGVRPLWSQTRERGDECASFNQLERAHADFMLMYGK